MITCIYCSVDKEDKYFPKGKHGCYSCRGTRERAQLKLDMLAALGSKCSCCGEENPYFLTLDHINNDGSEHREDYNEQQIYREARREGWPKDKYQLLCMNCNFAKGHFGECPHKKGISPQSAYLLLVRKAQIGR